MPSAQDCAERLREQAYRTLLPQIRDLEQELQSFSSSLSAAISQLGRKLEALRNIELPTTDAVLGEILSDIKLQKDHETGALVLFAHGLSQKETQEEILSFLLDTAQKYFSRVALFAVRKDRFVGWSSRGYPEERAQSIGSCSFARSECPRLEEAIGGSSLVTAADFIDDQGPLNLLQEPSGEPWHIVPLRAMQRPVAVIMASGDQNTPSSRDSLSVLAALAAMRLENVALRILYELTAAKPEAAPQPVRTFAAPVAAPAAAAEPVPEVVAAPAAVAEAESVEQEAAAEPEAAVVPEVEEAPATEPSPVVEVEEKPTPIVEASPETSAPQPPPYEPAVIQPQEPVQVGEEERLHSDAKRFARLLVSESKLYNEHHVWEGRENRDLYIRLKRDIDRSREMYEKRVSPSVARKIDYFHDEIIRILGDNDPSTLGSDYPGPRVES